MRGLVTPHLKQEPDRSRTPNSKELQRHYLESPHAKQQQAQPPRLPLDTLDRATKYKEENRRILQESIEVAPFTAKIRSGEAEREPYVRVSTHSLSGAPKETEHPAAELYKYKHCGAQALPQSNYFTTLSNSVVNEPPHLYSSKELNSLSNSNPLPLGSYGNAGNAKSLSKPPPLIKHQPESEGLVGKISEQLSQQVALHPTSSEHRSPAISPSSQLRGMPALYRAPVFHPPIQQILERKEVGYGRLSPPTLTPIQPVSSAGKVSEQQKPPTLLPELREVKSGMETWRPGHDLQNQMAQWHSDKSRGRPQVATASVIVRPLSCIKYDGSPGAKPSVKEAPMSKPHIDQVDLTKRAETGRVIQANTNLEHRVPQGFPQSASMDLTSSSSAVSVLNRSGAELPLCASNSRTPSVPESQECKTIRTASPTSVPPQTSLSPQAYSGNPIHLKKRKAALAAAQSHGSSSASESDGGGRSSQESPTIVQDRASPSSTAGKLCPLPNGQPSQLSQSNYHKLKKAWLTRHSEEDRNTNKTDKGSSTVLDIIKPCTVNLIASTSGDVELEKDYKCLEDRMVPEDKKARRTPSKRPHESCSDSGDDSDASDSKLEQRVKRQPKPTYKKKQNDMQRKKGENDRDEDDLKTNGIFRSAKEKTKLKLASSSKFLHFLIHVCTRDE